MTQDDPRGVAWRELTGGDTIPFVVLANPQDSRYVFNTGFDAGVLEGIRQAREALERWDEKDGWGQAPPSLWDALNGLENESKQ